MKNIIGGHRLKNTILLALPDSERAAIFPKPEFVSLPSLTVLAEKGAPIKFAYFVNAGLASIVSNMANNKTIEVGVCGTEGFVGLPLTVGFSTSYSRAYAGSRKRFQNKRQRSCPHPSAVSKSCDFVAKILARNSIAIGSAGGV